MVSNLTRNQAPACRLRVRAPCPPLCSAKFQNSTTPKRFRLGVFFCLFLAAPFLSFLFPLLSSTSRVLVLRAAPLCNERRAIEMKVFNSGRLTKGIVRSKIVVGFFAPARLDSRRIIVYL